MVQVPTEHRVTAKWLSCFKYMIPKRDRGSVTEALQNPSVGSGNPSLKACQAQVEKLATSNLFQGSEVQVKLLRYLALHSLCSPADHLKEYQIATEVLGRAGDYDPQIDSYVRVQVGRLRNKLAEYYNSAGAHDPVLIEIPKGRYAISFESRGVAAEPEPALETAAAAVSGSFWRKNLVVAVLSGTFTFLVTGGGMLFYFRSSSVRPFVPANSIGSSAPALATLWGPLLQNPSGPFVIYSNAAFVGSPITGMRYYNPALDSKHDVSQDHTGVGELVGVVKLASVFDRLGRPLRLKRAGLFTLDDALNNDLIFLGASPENAPLDKVTATHEFVLGFVSGGKSVPLSLVGGVGGGHWVFSPVHPRPGDPSGYVVTQAGTSRRTEYAVFAYVQGINPARHTVILEGLSTMSTQAAVEFSCDETSMESLLKILKVKPGSHVPSFEALLKVEVTDNVPVQSQVVDVRQTKD